MGSLGNPQSNWIPYMTSKDCTLGICSLYCPQWCYVVFPPPPPLQLLGDDDGSSSGPSLSPLVIAIIGVLASAFLLVAYYTIISKFCRSSSDPSGADPARGANSGSGGDHDDSGTTQEPWYVSTAGGLDEALIRSIAVCKYKRGSGMVEGTCSVCLSEFREDESVRLLPKCTHAFHVPCIDTWLKSHSNCPLCRSEVAFTGSFPILLMPLPASPAAQFPGNDSRRVSDNGTDPGRASVTPNSYSNDVTDEEEEAMTTTRDHAAKSGSLRTCRESGDTGTRDTVIEVSTEGFQPIRRSFSTGHSWQTVADILKEDPDGESQGEESTSASTNHVNAGSMKDSLEMCKIGHKRSFLHSMIDRPVPMKRSLSSGRLSLSVPRRTKGIRIPV